MRTILSNNLAKSQFLFLSVSVSQSFEYARCVGNWRYRFWPYTSESLMGEPHWMSWGFCTKSTYPCHCLLPQDGSQRAACKFWRASRHIVGKHCFGKLVQKTCLWVRKSLLQCLSVQEISDDATKAQELMSLTPFWLSWALLPSLVPSEAKYVHNWNDKGSPANRLLASGWSHSEPDVGITCFPTEKSLWKSRKQSWNSTCLLRTATCIVMKNQDATVFCESCSFRKMRKTQEIKIRTWFPWVSSICHIWWNVWTWAWSWLKVSFSTSNQFR